MRVLPDPIAVHRSPVPSMRSFFRTTSSASQLRAIILVGLYLISLQNYLLFHSIVEFAAIAVAFTIFILVWNTRRVITDSFFLLLGISFLFTGSIDLLHTLAYKGMGVFPGNSSDLPTQLWLAARYFQSITFFVATLLIGRSLTRDRKHDPAIFLAGCAVFSGLLLASIFVWNSFPHAFIEGSGLTVFKIASEYLISLILLATIVMLILRREHFDRSVWESPGRSDGLPDRRRTRLHIVHQRVRVHEHARAPLPARLGVLLLPCDCRCRPHPPVRSPPPGAEAERIRAPRE